MSDKLRDIPRQWAQPPAEMVGGLPKGGTTLDYVGHANVTRILLDIDPLWTLEPVCDERGIPIVEMQGSDAVMWGRLTVCGHTRMGVGTCTAKAFDLHKQLLSDLLRNCAMRFGIATALWSKEEFTDPPPPPEPAATPEQVGTIKAALSSLQGDVKDTVKAWWKDNGLPSITSGQLTERQAAVILDRLQNLTAGEGGGPAPEGSGDTGSETTEGVSSGERDDVTVESPEGTQPPGAAAARAALDKAKK